MLAAFDGLVCSRHARNSQSHEGRLWRPDYLDVRQVAPGAGREGAWPPPAKHFRGISKRSGLGVSSWCASLRGVLVLGGSTNGTYGTRRVLARVGAKEAFGSPDVFAAIR